MAAINKDYSKFFLNTTLARWLDADLAAPTLDCVGCTRPTKCCAFQPFVPNFLLGGFLKNGGVLPVSENLFFAPIGAVATKKYRERHGALLEDTHGTEFLCAFFAPDTRACTLWNFRPGECSSYFCDSARLNPQRQALSAQSFAIEIAVAQMALVEAGFSDQEIAQQIDLVNGAANNYPAADQRIVYKNAWNWSQAIDKNTLHGWNP